MEGKRVSNIDMSTYGEWIAYCDGVKQLPADHFWNRHSRAAAEKTETGCMDVNPYFILKTADNSIQMGWGPTQVELLCEDWFVLDDDE